MTAMLVYQDGGVLDHDQPPRERRAIRTALCALTFLLVLLTAGCGSFKSMRAGGLPKPVQIAQLDDDASAGEESVEAYGMTARQEPMAETSEPVWRAEADPFKSSDVPSSPPQVNVFGEFDGVVRAGQREPSASGFQQHTYLEEGCDSDVAVDPTGKWLIFASTRHSERAEIYRQRADGSGTSVTQLTSDAADDANPVFRADGAQIAFCSTRGGDWDIYTMDPDGRNVVQITSGPQQDLHPSYSPDGTRLAYCSAGPRGAWELWTVNLHSGERRQIGYGLFPSWSPHGEVDRIAFQRPRQRGSRWFSLWTLDLIDGEARNLTEVAVSSNAAIVGPNWSPDGHRLAFTTIVEPANSDGAASAGREDVWVVNDDGTNKRRLTDGQGASRGPWWASDGRVFFVSDRGGTETVWSVRAGPAAAAIATSEEPHVTPQAAQPQPEPHEQIGSTDVGAHH